MKTNYLIALICLTCLFSCKKESKHNPGSNPKLTSVADSVYSVSLSHTQAVAIYQDAADLKINCAAYQLTDAIRGYLTDNILAFIYSAVKNDPDGYLSYDDLFDEYPALKTDVENYMENHSYNQAYDFDNYEDIKTAFVRGGITYEPCINMPFMENLGSGFTAHADDLVWIIPAEIEDDDVNSQDNVFGWQITSSGTATIGIGENAAIGTTTSGTPIFGTNTGKRGSGGSSSKTTPMPWDPNANPWGLNAGPGDANISMVNIAEKFEGNKFSEVRLAKGTSDWDATAVFSGKNSGSSAISVSNINNRTNLNNNVWITPVFVTTQINYGDDKFVVYNLFEYDWYATNKLLGRQGKGYHDFIGGKMKYDGEYYLFPTSQTQQDASALDHMDYRSFYANGSLTITGNHGNCQID